MAETSLSMLKMSKLGREGKADVLKTIEEISAEEDECGNWRQALTLIALLLYLTLTPSAGSAEIAVLTSQWVSQAWK